MNAASVIASCQFFPSPHLLKKVPGIDVIRSDSSSHVTRARARENEFCTQEMPIEEADSIGGGGILGLSVESKICIQVYSHVRAPPLPNTTHIVFFCVNPSCVHFSEVDNFSPPSLPHCGHAELVSPTFDRLLQYTTSRKQARAWLQMGLSFSLAGVCRV